MVRYDHMFVVFCAHRAQKTTQEKRGHTRSAEGSDRQLRKSYILKLTEATENLQKKESIMLSQAKAA